MSVVVGVFDVVMWVAYCDEGIYTCCSSPCHMLMRLVLQLCIVSYAAKWYCDVPCQCLWECECMISELSCLPVAVHRQTQ